LAAAGFPAGWSGLNMIVAAWYATVCLIPRRDCKEAVPAWKKLSLYYAKLNSCTDKFVDRRWEMMVP
jgi:hypothetical protein